MVRKEGQEGDCYLNSFTIMRKYNYFYIFSIFQRKKCKHYGKVLQLRKKLAIIYC